MLPAEDLAELVVRLEPCLSARRDQLLHVGPADDGDEAAGVGLLMVAKSIAAAAARARGQSGPLQLATALT